MKELIAEFRKIIYSSEEKFLKVSGEESNNKPQPEKWSSKQLLGHLVDSSINNIVRFINGQFREDFVFTGYDQDKWVTAQRYDEAEWEIIVSMWKNNNLQIANVVEFIPEDIFTRPHSNHNSNLISFVKVPRDKPFTLEYIFTDYIAHMKHHLNQIFRMNNLEEI